MGFMHVKVIFGRGVYMGAMVNCGPILIKFDTKIDNCTELLKAFLVLKLYFGDIFMGAR